MLSIQAVRQQITVIKVINIITQLRPAARTHAHYSYESSQHTGQQQKHTKRPTTLSYKWTEGKAANGHDSAHASWSRSETQHVTWRWTYEWQTRWRATVRGTGQGLFLTNPLGKLTVNTECETGRERNNQAVQWKWSQYPYFTKYAPKRHSLPVAEQDFTRPLDQGHLCLYRQPWLYISDPSNKINHSRIH